MASFSKWLLSCVWEAWYSNFYNVGNTRFTTLDQIDVWPISYLYLFPLTLTAILTVTPKVQESYWESKMTSFFGQVVHFLNKDKLQLKISLLICLLSPNLEIEKRKQNIKLWYEDVHHSIMNLFAWLFRWGNGLHFFFIRTSKFWVDARCS